LPSKLLIFITPPRGSNKRATINRSAVKVLVITALAVNVEHNHEGGQQYKTN
jgi:hypothetical protein